MASPRQPLVSIVIPLYNQQLPFLKQALDSALNQTYTNVEVIVSDNHSTNDVPAYLAAIANPRLHVVRPPIFLPMMQHFQFAADQVTGDYISFLSSDDWIAPNCVEVLTNQLITYPQAALAYCEIENVDHVDLNKIRLYTNRRESGLRTAADSLNELIHARPFFAWIPGGVVKKTAYQHVRELFDGEIKFAADVALLFKLHEFGDIIYVNEPLAKFRIWTAKEGKLGGPRLLENISDIGRVCALLEQSPRLVSYLTNGQEDIKQWRAYQAKRWIMALLVGVITGNISPIVCKEGISAIRQHISPDPAGAFALSVLVGKPQFFIAKPLLSGMYTLYLAVQYRLKKAF